MRLYSSHFAVPDAASAGAAAPPVLVPDGFSWWGLILGWLVFLRTGSWLVAMLTGTATLLIDLATRPLPACWVLLPALHLAIALFAADWRRWELRLGGLVAGPIVGGRDAGSALLRLLDLGPDRLVRPAGAAVAGTGEP